MVGGAGSVWKRSVFNGLCLSLQVNREIVSGLKYIQHTFRKGVKSKCLVVARVLLRVRLTVLSTAVVGACLLPQLLAMQETDSSGKHGHVCAAWPVAACEGSQACTGVAACGPGALR